MAEIDQVQELLDVAARGERKAVKAGHGAGDPLLWALIPLYLLRHTRTDGAGTRTQGAAWTTGRPLPLTGGDVARFWARHGIWRTRGTVTGALRRHIGYAMHVTRGPRLFHGWVIVPNGVKYVEACIAKAVRRG